MLDDIKEMAFIKSMGTQGSSMMPVVLLLIFIMYILWKQQQDMWKMMIMSHSKKNETRQQLPHRQLGIREGFNSMVLSPY